MTYEELAKQEAPFRVKSIHSGGLAGWCLTFDLTKLGDLQRTSEEAQDWAAEEEQ